MSRPPLAPLLPTRQLAVFTVFFGQLPPWLPLTLQSMAYNPGVSFIVIGDAAPPALLPPNVHFETVSYPEMQARQHAQSAPLAAPQLGACASSGCAWLLGSPRKWPAHWVPSHRLGCSSQPPPLSYPAMQG